MANIPVTSLISGFQTKVKTAEKARGVCCFRDDPLAVFSCAFDTMKISYDGFR